MWHFNCRLSIETVLLALVAQACTRSGCSNYEAWESRDWCDSYGVCLTGTELQKGLPEHESSGIRGTWASEQILSFYSSDNESLRNDYSVRQLLNQFSIFMLKSYIIINQKPRHLITCPSPFRLRTTYLTLTCFLVQSRVFMKSEVQAHAVTIPDQDVWHIHSRLHTDLHIFILVIAEQRRAWGIQMRDRRRRKQYGSLLSFLPVNSE